MKCFASVRPEEQCKCKVKEIEQKNISAMKGQQKGGKGKAASEFEMWSPG